jgi:hypothetical protein
MADQDGIKDVSKLSDTTDTSELQEDDLKAVTGGLSSSGGSTSSGDVCVSSY